MGVRISDEYFQQPQVAPQSAALQKQNVRDFQQRVQATEQAIDQSAQAQQQQQQVAADAARIAKDEVGGNTFTKPLEEQKDLQTGLPVQDVKFDPAAKKVLDDYLSALTPEQRSYRQSKIDQGAWTSRDAAEEEFKALAHAQDLLNARAVNFNAMADRAIGQAEAAQSGYTPGEAPLPTQQEAEDIQAGQQYVQQQLKGIVERHPEYARELAQQKADQYVADVMSKEPALAPYYQLIQPATQAVKDFAANILRTPRTFGGSDYGWTDSLADWAEGVQENYKSRAPSEYKGSLNWNNALPKAVGAVSSAAILGATSPSGIGLVANSFVQTNADYFKDAQAAGLSKGEATTYATSAATITSLLELLAPNDYVAGSVKRSFADASLKALAGGTLEKEAVREGLKAAFREGGEEFTQEALQYLADKGVNHLTNQITGGGELNDQVKVRELMENAVLGFVAGGLLSGSSAVGTPYRQAAIQYAVNNPEETLKGINAADFLTPEQKTQATEKLTTLVKTYKGNDLAQLTPDVAEKVADVLDRKQQVERDIKENPMDPVLEAAEGDSRKAEVEQLAREVLEAKGVTGQAQTDALVNAKIIEPELDAEGKPIKPQKVKPKLKKPQEDAQAVRSNEGQVQEGGNVGAEGEGQSGGDLQLNPQEPSGNPEEQVTPSAAEPVSSPEVLPTQNEPATTEAPTPEQTPPEPSDQGGVGAEGQAGVPAQEVAPNEVQKTFVGRRLYEGQLRDEVRSELEKLGLTRNVESHEEAQQKAQELIDKVGLDAALGAVRANEVTGAPAAYIHNAALTDILNRAVEAKTPEEKQILSAEAAALSEEIGAHQLRSGQYNAAYADIYPNSEIAYNSVARAQQYEKQFGKAPTEEQLGQWQQRDKLFAEYRQKIADLEQQLRQEKEKAAFKAIQDSLDRAKRRNPKAHAEAAARLAAHIRSLKIGDKGISATIIPPQLWDGAVEAMARITEAGGKVADAIANGLQVIRESDWYRNASEKDQQQAQQDLTDGLIAYGLDLSSTKEEVQKEIRRLKADKLEVAKGRARERIADLERRLKEGDFSKKKAAPTEADKELRDLRAKQQRLKDEYDVEWEKEVLRNRNIREKAYDAVIDALNLPKTLLSTLDFSAPLRQGAILSAGNPRAAGRATAEMFRQAFSKEKADLWLAHLKQSSQYDLMKQSGLYIAQPTAKLTAKEESFVSNFAERIPGLGKLVRGSERAYAGYLNKLRADVFTYGANQLQDQGKTFQSHPRDYQELAKFINNATGRGSLGWLEEAAPAMNAVFFSPRLIASRFNLLNPVRYARMPKQVRMMALRNMLSFLGFWGLVAALLKANGAEEEFDPTSTDFGKFKFGNTRYDLSAGFAQPLRLMARLATGRGKSATGKEYSLDGKDFPYTSRMSELGQFARTKLSPAAGIAVDYLSGGKDLLGQPVTISSEAQKLFIPLVLQDMKSMYKDSGPTGVLTSVLPAMFGVGVQTYSGQKTSPVQVDRRGRVRVHTGIMDMPSRPYE